MLQMLLLSMFGERSLVRDSYQSKQIFTKYNAWGGGHIVSKVDEMARYQDLAQTYIFYICYPITRSLTSSVLRILSVCVDNEQFQI